jgi:pimeloyl-ACP methyl ester carboxylesterase
LAKQVQQHRTVIALDSIKMSAIILDGRKTPVLLLHGNSSHGDIFRHQVAALRAAGHGCIAPDLPGHGRSEDAANPQTTYSFPGYANTLRKLLNTLGVSTYHVVGWSLGGHVGIELWYSDARARSLLITGTPPTHLSPSGAARAFNSSSTMNLAGTRKFGPAEVMNYGTAMTGARLDRRSGLARAITRTDGNARHWMMKNSLAGVGTDQVKAVRECERPLGIVQGKRDPFVNIPYLQSLKYNNLWLRQPMLVDAGHAPHIEKPQLFNQQLREFLSQVD